MRHDCRERDGAHEDVGASVVSGGEAAPVLELGEEVFGWVTLAVEGRV